MRGENVAQHADADVVSTFIYSELDSGVLEKLPSLKLIATRSTCFDHIDTDYCTAPSTRERPPARIVETTVENIGAYLAGATRGTLSPPTRQAPRDPGEAVATGLECE